MHVLLRLASTVRNLIRRSHVDRELDAELQSALDLIADEKMATGLNEADARRAARIELGGLEQVRTRVRETRAGAGLDRLTQDLRGAVRWMWRAPGFATATILIMSLGLGSVTAVFAVVSAVLFSPPAGIPASDRLVGLDRLKVDRPGAPTTMSYTELLEYQQRTDLLEVAAAQPLATAVRVGQRHERIEAELATDNYFDVLGVRIRQGRSFTPSSGIDEAIASDRFLRTLGVAGDGLGTVIDVSGHSFVIVGIVPGAFMGTEQPHRRSDLWLPAAARRRLNPSLSPERAQPSTDVEDRGWTVVGRLHDGVNVSAAAAALRVTARDLERRHPDALLGISVGLRPGLLLRAERSGQVAVTLWLTLAAVWLLLVIGCANVANLTLARTLGRSKEIALRLALGASRRRVVRQLLTESVLLATIASAGGIVLAPWMLAALGTAMPPEAQVLLLAGVTLADWRVILFLFATTVVVALIAGLIPALQGTKVSLSSAMKHGGPSGPRARRTRLVFVTVQVALAVVLLSGSGLLVRALQAAYAVPLGYETKGLVVATVDLPPHDDPARRDLDTRMQAELARQPALLQASLAAQSPLKGGGALVASFTRVDAAEQPLVNVNAHVLQNYVGPGYFETLGLAVRRGRSFSAQDTHGAEPVVIVNEALARQRWANEDPIGTSIRLGHETAPRTVVGVVSQAQHIGLDGTYAEGLYLPLTQAKTPLSPWVVVLRASGDLPSAIWSAQRALDTVGPNLLLYDARPMEYHIAKVVFVQRTMAIVTGTFGLAALLLTAAGLSATVSFVVAQRTQEIGIRMALGAQRQQVIRLVMGQGLALIMLGAALGLTLFAGSAVLLTRNFSGLSVLDPVVPLVACALLGVVALTAMIVPARRAARVDPCAALRAE